MEQRRRHLSNNKILKTKPQKKGFALHDVGALFYLKKISSKKLWHFLYHRPNNSSHTNLSFGSYPALTLAVARQMCDQFISLLAERINPQKQQAEISEQHQTELDSIFSVVAEWWFQLKSKSVTEDYAKDVWRSLKKEILPIIGEISVQAPKARTIVEALEPTKARSTLKTDRRLTQRINEIMIHAINFGRIDANSASNICMAFEYA